MYTQLDSMCVICISKAKLAHKELKCITATFSNQMCTLVITISKCTLVIQRTVAIYSAYKYNQ